MVEAGVLHEHDRVELVEGVLVDMVPIGPEHDGAFEWLNSRFTRAETEAWRVRVQSVLLTAGGYLLSDLLLVAPLPRTVQPSTAHLAIEVAQTSQARDLVEVRDYAAADVDEYWIVDLPRTNGHRASLPARRRLPGGDDLRRRRDDHPATPRRTRRRRERPAADGLEDEQRPKARSRRAPRQARSPLSTGDARPASILSPEGRSGPASLRPGPGAGRMSRTGPLTRRSAVPPRDAARRASARPSAPRCRRPPRR